MKHNQDSPIFLIGAARSGTKFARSILAASKDMGAVGYDVNYIWRYGNEGLEHDELNPASLTPKMKAYIKRQLGQQAGIDAGNSKTLVEKTVGNTLRVPFINAVFPNARYIHLIRDGRAVTESSMRMWQASPDTGSLLKKLRQMPLSSSRYLLWFGYNFAKGLVSGRRGGQVWGPRYKGIMDDVQAERPLVEICAHQWQSSVEKAYEGLTQIDPDKVFSLKYDDLVRNEDRIREMLDFSQVRDWEKAMAHHRATVHKGNDDKWKQCLSKDDTDKMMVMLTPTLTDLGFLPDTKDTEKKEGIKL